MNQKIINEFIEVALLWSIILFGIGLHGLFAAKTYILIFLWIIFILGSCLIISVLEKYVTIKVK